MNTSLIPADFIPGKSSDVNLKIRFFDISTNMNIERVTYRVQIFYGTQLVANQMFFDKDGDLDIKIQPRSECDQEELWKCTKYQGETDPVVPNALTSSALSTPIITGPVFSKSGQYTVKTAIIGATNPKTQTTEDITFETAITIPHEQQFMIASSNTQYPILVK
ncbi:MAG: peptidase, partial [Nitrosopumilaceae archaeon]